MTKGRALHFIKNGTIATVGFLLSPLSWWNDLLVNVPLAYGFAFLAGKLFSFFEIASKNFFIALFVLGYWLTNVVGMAMLRLGAVDIVKYEEEKLPRYEKKLLLDFKWDILIACAYSAFIAWLVYSDYGNILSFLRVYPDWIGK